VENDNFKIVELTYTESASVMVKAESNEQATQGVLETFSEVPDLKIISISDADPELVKEVKGDAEFQTIEPKVLN